ncbi:MAG: Ig domain-containing protein [Bacillota bacterium]|nr:Ig domain-containing protein [Bacillota bacterium]
MQKISDVSNVSFMPSAVPVVSDRARRSFLSFPRFSSVFKVVLTMCLIVCLAVAVNAPVAEATTTLEIITDPYLPGANRNTWYSTSLSASGGTTPYKWSLPSGSLPSGLSLSESGVISGTPTSGTGNFSVTIQVKDDDNRTESKTFTITVYETDQTPLSITRSSTLTRGRKGSSYSTSLTASGGRTPYTWSWVSGSLPPGLSLSSSGVVDQKYHKGKP